MAMLSYQSAHQSGYCNACGYTCYCTFVHYYYVVMV